MSALTVTGEPGKRRLRDGHHPVFTEHWTCGWIVLHQANTWEEWQEIARMILDTPDPDA